MKPLSKQGVSVVPIVVPTPYDVGDVNMYLYEDAGNLTLIDAAFDSDEAWDRLQTALSEHGWNLQQLSAIWLTHHHQDHIGLVNRMAAKRDIPVYAHPKAMPRLRRDESFLDMRADFFEQLYRKMGCGEAGERQVRRIRESKHANARFALHTDVLPVTEGSVLGSCRVMEVPGHAPDHVVFWDESRGWLFGGDHLIAHISSNAIVEPDERGERILSLVEYEASLRRCVGIGAEFVWSGHGEPIQDADSLTTQRLKRMGEKAERMLGLIRSGLTTAFEMAKTLYPSKHETVFGLVMSEVIGLLDFLESTGRVEVFMQNGVLQYTISK